jgi:hypothetical protein
LGGLAGAPKRPVRCPAGHHFKTAGGDALGEMELLEGTLCP